MQYIEVDLGIETKIVRLLKAFHEKLCTLNVDIPLETKLAKSLLDQLALIKHTAKQELVINKIEVVFFPYSASMWDSFESIYLCAKEDVNCEAFVVPIPYFDRNPDNSLGAMHFDGALYPANIPITDWKDYDVEAHRPDIIFIHNAYDNQNLVTSVHPNYYTSRLKNYTRNLVYVEYGMPHIVQKTPELISFLHTYFNFDTQVVHSKYLAKQFKYNYKHEKVFGKDVVALGSCKFDKVVNTSRFDYPLPLEWRYKLINRQDGTYKKVLLYNTSIYAILQNIDKTLENITKTIATLKKRDDIILWWRPHPLAHQTIFSMRNSYIRKFETIVNEFIQDDIGIYDTTEDVHRAISWSDAYYGDESSLVYLYLATGKPFSIVKHTDISENPEVYESATFHKELETRIKRMETAKGANVGNWNCCIWWDNFCEYDYLEHKINSNFLNSFIHYIINNNDYPKAQRYKELSLRMYEDFVENPDGTAGEKIYQYCKEKVTPHKEFTTR